MPLVVKDRVRETSATAGTGAITLGGAVSGFQSFSVIGNGNTTYYTIVDSLTGSWEVGIGTYTSSGTTLSRDTVLESSNSGNLVNFSANSKDVFCTYPAERSAYADGSTIASPAANLTANRVMYATSTSAIGQSANLTFDGTTLTTTAISDSGNLTFTGTGNRITGDFSNATIASRVIFQTSTTNGNTAVNAIPNGAATTSGFGGFNSSDPANAGRWYINATVSEVNFSSDKTGTGTYLPMTFYTGGSERMRIDSSGNVGIGTTLPGQKLDVNGSLNVGPTIFTGTGASTGDVAIELGGNRTGSGNSYIDFHSTASTDFEFRILRNGGVNGAVDISNTGTGDFRLTQGGAGALTFNTNSSERMRVDTSGNVGIGTTSPAQKLQVVGNVYVGNVSNPRIIAYNTGGTLSDITIGADSGIAWIGSSSTNTPIYFSVNNTERMRIDSSGNVGIGTSSPIRRLDVAGSARFVQDNPATTGAISLRQNTGDTVGGYIQWVNNDNSAEKGWMVVDTLSNMIFAPSGSEKMRIDSSGNLLVGTTSTTNNSRLKVQGSSTSSADYMVQFTNSAGANAIYIKNDRSVFSDGIYNSTTASAANVFINGSAQLQRSTSSLKYKTDVHDATHGLAEVMQLRPVTYKGKNDGDTVFGGLIAEEVDAAGLTEFVQYADDGTPDALAYGNMVSLCIKAIQELKAELDATKAEVAALKGA